MTTLKTNEARAAHDSRMTTRVMFIGLGLAFAALFGLLAYFA